MKIKVTKDLCEIKENEIWNVGDYNVHTVQVELSPEFNGLVNKVRYFVEDNSYDMLITDNVAQVPYEATVMEGTIKIGVYGYDADTDILVQSTSPVNKYITSGTYTGEANNTQPLTPTDKQQMETAIQKNADDIINLQNNKQDVLISGENIKTINNESILGEGNIEIDVGSINYNDLENKPKINNVELSGNKSLNDLGIQPEGNYATIDDLTEESRVILTEVATSYYNKNQTNNLLNTKQNTLISGQNIKTINSESLLGEGNIIIQGGGSSDYEDLENLPKINNIELKGNKSLNDLGIQPAGNYALESEIPTKTSDLTNDSGFISNTTNNLVNYTLKTNTGSLIDLEINQTTYVVTLSLKDVDGNIISTDTIDLPLENVVVSGAYDSTNQKIVLTLQSGDTVDIPVGALVSGLQSEITSQNKLASDLVDDTNSGNKFVTTSEKTTWDNKLDQSDLTNYVTNTDYGSSSTAGVFRTNGTYGTTRTSSGVLYGVGKTYAEYTSSPTQLFISKGTLENVITGKELDLKRLSTFDSTKTQVLKNINGTLTWVNE